MTMVHKSPNGLSIPSGLISTHGPATDKLGATPSPIRELSIILKELKVITESIKSEQKSSMIKNDWKFAAMVLDRLCLLAFTVFTVVATLALFGTAPHILVP